MLIVVLTIWSIQERDVKLRRSTSVNKEPEEIEMLVFYYAGLGIQGLIRQR